MLGFLHQYLSIPGTEVIATTFSCYNDAFVARDSHKCQLKGTNLV